MIEKGAVIFNAEGSCVNSVLGNQQNKQQIITLSIAWLIRLDDILNSEELQQLGVEEKDKIRELFDQGVKHKMKMNFVRQMSKTSGLLLCVWLLKLNIRNYFKLWVSRGVGQKRTETETRFWRRLRMMMIKMV